MLYIFFSDSIRRFTSCSECSNPRYLAKDCCMEKESTGWGHQAGHESWWFIWQAQGISFFGKPRTSMCLTLFKHYSNHHFSIITHTISHFLFFQLKSSAHSVVQDSPFHMDDIYSFVSSKAPRDLAQDVCTLFTSFIYLSKQFSFFYLSSLVSLSKHFRFMSKYFRFSCPSTFIFSLSKHLKSIVNGWTWPLNQKHVSWNDNFPIWFLPNLAIYNWGVSSYRFS